MTAVGALIMIIAFIAFLVLDKHKSEKIEVITTEYKKDSIKLREVLRAPVQISKRVIQPVAYAIPTKGTTSTNNGSLPLFTFYLHLKTIDSVKSSISSVDYFFNHPTFRKKHQVSKDSASDFKISYTGWGCLDTVTIAITKKNKSTDTIYFRMCNNLKLEGLSIGNPND